MAHKATKTANTIPTIATILQVLLSIQVSHDLNESAVDFTLSPKSRRNKLLPIYMFKFISKISIGDAAAYKYFFVRRKSPIYF